MISYCMIAFYVFTKIKSKQFIDRENYVFDQDKPEK